MTDQTHIRVLFFDALINESNCWNHMASANQNQHPIDDSFFQLNLANNLNSNSDGSFIFGSGVEFWH